MRVGISRYVSCENPSEDGKVGEMRNEIMKTNSLITDDRYVPTIVHFPAIDESQLPDLIIFGRRDTTTAVESRRDDRRALTRPLSRPSGGSGVDRQALNRDSVSRQGDDGPDRRRNARFCRAGAPTSNRRLFCDAQDPIHNHGVIRIAMGSAARGH
jgi:hypothetical protein